MRPDLSGSKDLLSMQVTAILAHELGHAAVDVAARYGKAFRRIVHTTRKWPELAGAPLCPKHGQMDTEKMQSPTTL